MNNFTNHIFFISAEKSNHPSMVNSVNSLDLHYQLKREFDSVTPVSGCYNGVTEQSYLVSIPFSDVSRAKTVLERIAASYDQDCIAYVDNERVLTLLYSNGNSERIRTLKENSNATDNFTECNGKRYSAE